LTGWLNHGRQDVTLHNSGHRQRGLTKYTQRDRQTERERERERESYHDGAIALGEDIS